MAHDHPPPSAPSSSRLATNTFHLEAESFIEWLRGQYPRHS